MPAPRNNLEHSPALRRKLTDLPTQPGVYLYRDQEGSLLYVGKAKVLRNRVKSYFQSRQLDGKTRRLVARIWDLEFVVCETELEALVLENNFIKEHRPPYNILLRDDKSYPYVKLTWKNAFPQVFVTRKVKKDGSLYFGPFFPASTAYRTAELAYRFFQIPQIALVVVLIVLGAKYHFCMVSPELPCHLTGIAGLIGPLSALESNSKRMHRFARLLAHQCQQ